jgi:hypothetical protein
MRVGGVAKSVEAGRKAKRGPSSRKALCRDDNGNRSDEQMQARQHRQRRSCALGLNRREILRRCAPLDDGQRQAGAGI